MILCRGGKEQKQQDFLNHASLHRISFGTIIFYILAKQHLNLKSDSQKLFFLKATDDVLCSMHDENTLRVKHSPQVSPSSWRQTITFQLQMCRVRVSHNVISNIKEEQMRFREKEKKCQGKHKGGGSALGQNLENIELLS